MLAVYCYSTGSWNYTHVSLLCLAADAGYINIDCIMIKVKIKQNIQIALLRVNKIITKIFRNIRRKTVQSI